MTKHEVTARIGEALHVEAWRQRVTTTELGAAMGVSQSVASKKLRGLVPLTVDELDAACRRLDVSPADVVMGLPRQDSNLKPAGYRRRRKLEAV